MSHDSHEIPQGEASQQGIFIGWLAAGLGAFAALFTLFVLISAAIGH